MPDIINNGQHGTVYLICRNSQQDLPDSFQAVVNQVNQNPGTQGNYELLPAKKARVDASKFIVAATSTTLVIGPRLVGQQAEQNLWTQ
jgi:hypothetical protein